MREKYGIKFREISKHLMEKNLEKENALEKFMELVHDINVCMFITNSSETDHTRPMATVDIDKDGILWFYTDIRSIKIEEVSMEHKVHLVYAHPGKESYLDVWGQANVITDKVTVTNKWKPIMKAWFPGGPGDPNVALLKVKPYRIYYWDAEAGKMVSFLKIAAKSIGAKISEGVEGSLKL